MSIRIDVICDQCGICVWAISTISVADAWRVADHMGWGKSSDDQHDLCPECMEAAREVRDTVASRMFIHKELGICYWWCPNCDYQVEAAREE